MKEGWFIRDRKRMKRKIAIFASGSGTNFEALVQACERGAVNGEVVLMVCDKAGAYVTERAKRHGVETFVFCAKEYENKAAFETEICERMDALGVELVCLAGYMRIVGETLLARYGGRIVNIHPALLPSFKGAHAIDDAFAFGVKVYGVTVHLIDETVDGGTIVAQRAFEYYGDDRDEVERRIHEVEHELYPEAVAALLRCMDEKERTYGRGGE